MHIMKVLTESAVFSVPARLTYTRPIVAVTMRAGCTSWIALSLIARGTRPAVVTEAALTGTSSVRATVHRAQL